MSLIIAPRDSMRMEVYRYALGAVMAKPELEAMLAGPPKVDSFTLKRPDGNTVSFETGVATAGGTAARSRWYLDYALDESAFFRDDSFKVNDEELFRAGSSTLLPGGQVLVTSTPWAEAGLLYRLWKERPEGTIVAHAPTLLLNDSPETQEAVTQARAQDPDNAKREFDAEFMTSGTLVFFESGALDAAMTEEPFEVRPGDIIAAGADLGFRSDSSALVFVALRGDTLHVFDGIELRPPSGVGLSPEDTCSTFAKLMEGRVQYVMADQHYQDTLADVLARHHLTVAPAPAVPSEYYVRARQVFRSERVKIHPLPFRDRLVRQLREVQGRPTSGGGMSMHHPRWASGGHGDIADAMTLALFQVTGDAVAAPKPEEGTREWEEAARERRQRKLMERNERAEWMPKGAANDRGRGAHWRR